jgi:hypothetical protein
VKRGFEPYVERAVSLLERLVDRCIVHDLGDDDQNYKLSKPAALLGKCLIVFNQMSGLGLEPVRFISPARLLSYARTAIRVNLHLPSSSSSSSSVRSETHTDPHLASVRA